MEAKASISCCLPSNRARTRYPTALLRSYRVLAVKLELTGINRFPPGDAQGLNSRMGAKTTARPGTLGEYDVEGFTRLARNAKKSEVYADNS